MNDIDKLLENYFNGTASREEEQKLKNYFAEPGILPEHEIYRPLFALFKKEKEIKAPTIRLPEKKSFTRRIIALGTGAAAAILLAIMIINPNSQQNKDMQYVVIVNGKKIMDQHKAREYAESVFAEAEKIVEDSYHPLREATKIEEELNAERIFRETEEKIASIKTNHQQN